MPINSRPRPAAALGLLAACFAVLTSSLAAQDQKAKKSSATVATPETPAAGPASRLTDFGKQIPAQRKNLGVSIPSFSGGMRSSLIEAESMTRLDDIRLFAEKMTIFMFGEMEKDNVTVAMPSATFNMSSQILRSDERSKVSRADFDLEGDSLLFDTVTSQGRMTGNVRMIIHDAQSLMPNSENLPGGSGGSAKANPATAPAQSAPPQEGVALEDASTTATPAKP